MTPSRERTSSAIDVPYSHSPTSSCVKRRTGRLMTASSAASSRWASTNDDLIGRDETATCRTIGRATPGARRTNVRSSAARARRTDAPRPHRARLTGGGALPVDPLHAVHHLALTVTDIDRAVNWYTSLLDTVDVTRVRGDGFDKAILRTSAGLMLGLTAHDRGARDTF